MHDISYNAVSKSVPMFVAVSFKGNITLSPLGPDGPGRPPCPLSPLGPTGPGAPIKPSGPGGPDGPKGPGWPCDKKKKERINNWAQSFF